MVYPNMPFFKGVCLCNSRKFILLKVYSSSESSVVSPKSTFLRSSRKVFLSKSLIKKFIISEIYGCRAWRFEISTNRFMKIAQNFFCSVASLLSFCFVCQN